MEIGTSKIGNAITFAVAAGRLRAASRENGYLAGLEKQADRFSAVFAALLKGGESAAGVGSGGTLSPAVGGHGDPAEGLAQRDWNV